MRRRWLGALVVPALLAGCGGEPTAPVPGSFDVIFEGPSRPLGGLLFLLEGGPVDTVEAVQGSGVRFLDAATYSGVAEQVLVAGDRLDGVIARVRVPDLRLRYRVVVQEAADAEDFALRPTDGLRLFLVPRVP